MHQTYYLKNIVSELQNVVTAIGTGPAGTQDVNVTNVSIPVTNPGLTELYNSFDTVNHHLEVDTNAINGVAMSVDSGNKGTGVQRVCIATDDINLAAINLNCETLSSTVVSNQVNVNLAASDITLPVSGSVTVSGTPAVTVSSGSINATCSGTVAISSVAGTVTTSGTSTVSGSVSITGTPTVVISGTPNVSATIVGGTVGVSGTTSTNISAVGGSAAMTNSGTLGNGVQRICIATDDINTAAINTSLSNINKQMVRQAGGSMESLVVAEYKLIYKSSYPNSYASLLNRFESYNSNTTLHAQDGGVNLYPTSAPSSVGCATRFNLINGNNTWLIIFNELCASTAGSAPNIECGLAYYDSSSYIKIVNDYTGTTQPSLQYTLNDIGSTTVSMSSWNVDIFNGSGLSGIDLTGSTNKKQPLSWFFIVGSQTNYAYVGIVEQGKLWMGHQFPIKVSTAISSSSSKINQIGFRPYYFNTVTTANISTYSGGFEIYSKLGSYLNLPKQPHNFYNSYTVNASTTVYPFSIFARTSNLSNSYIQLQKLHARSTGTSDVGDFRIEVWHTQDNGYTITGGTTVNNISSSIIHGMTSISGGSKIATFLPGSDTCIIEDIKWIDHKYFGFDIANTAGYTSIIYFLLINMSASVNKTIYFSVHWFE